MKIITLITILLLSLLNILTIPLFLNIHQIKTNINNLATSIPDNTIYVNSNTNQYDLDNAKFITELKTIPGVKDVSSHNMYTLQGLYLDGTIDTNNNKIVGRYTIPTVILDDPSQQQYPIIAGNNISGDNQIVISSALVEHLGKTPIEMVNSSTYSMKIVGVYDDPNPYNQYNSEYSYKLFNYDNWTTTNLAYTVDSGLQEQNQMKAYDLLLAPYDESNVSQDQIQQAIAVTFDNEDTKANLDTLIKQIGDDNVYMSNLGISDPTKRFEAYHQLNRYNNNLIKSLAITDIIGITLLIYFNRKESK